MTVCGYCVEAYGYDHEKVSRCHVAATSPIGGTTYWFGFCDECGGLTAPCLTPMEAKARIAKGMYAIHDKKVVGE